MSRSESKLALHSLGVGRQESAEETPGWVYCYGILIDIGRRRSRPEERLEMCVGTGSAMVLVGPER